MSAMATPRGAHELHDLVPRIEEDTPAGPWAAVGGVQRLISRQGGSRPGCPTRMSDANCR